MGVSDQDKDNSSSQGDRSRGGWNGIVPQIMSSSFVRVCGDRHTSGSSSASKPKSSISGTATSRALLPPEPGDLI